MLRKDDKDSMHYIWKLMIKFQNLAVLYKMGPTGVSYNYWSTVKDGEKCFGDFCVSPET